MTTTNDYAILSQYVYNVRNKLENRPALPNGWTELQWYPDARAGFSYGVYQKGNDIVISYAGTNEGIDWASNISNRLGLSSSDDRGRAGILHSQSAIFKRQHKFYRPQFRRWSGIHHGSLV